MMETDDRRSFLSSMGTAAVFTLVTLVPTLPSEAAEIPTTIDGANIGGSIVYGDESIMSTKAHGKPKPQQDEQGMSQ